MHHSAAGCCAWKRQVQGLLCVGQTSPSEICTEVMQHEGTGVLQALWECAWSCSSPVTASGNSKSCSLTAADAVLQSPPGSPDSTCTAAGGRLPLPQGPAGQQDSAEEEGRRADA